MNIIIKQISNTNKSNYNNSKYYTKISLNKIYKIKEIIDKLSLNFL